MIPLGYLWLIPVFVVGAAVGSFLNVCIHRLPLEKSLLWPGSRCVSCLEPIRWYDNLPLLSWWLLRGRCRTCGARFSVRYFLVELLTAAGFAALFHLVVLENVHRFELLSRQQWSIHERGEVPWEAWVVVGHHALLFSLLVVTSFCDLDHREIPLSVTGWGTVAGLAFAIACPWPWPHTVSEALAGMPQGLPWWLLSPTVGPRFGLYPWPVWGPLPDWLSPGDPWTTGLATGLAGLLVGSILVRSIRFLFSVGLGVEALGLGDADILMMAGAFLGWQPAVIAFFLAVFPAVVLGIGQLIVRGEHAVPFGPSLAVGILGAMLGWAWIAPAVQVLFFNGLLLLVLALLSGTFLFLSGLGLGLMRKMRE